MTVVGQAMVARRSSSDGYSPSSRPSAPNASGSIRAKRPRASAFDGVPKNWLIASNTAPMPSARPSSASWSMTSTGMPDGSAEVSISTSEATRSGRSSAHRIAITPPIEWPSRWNGAISNSSTAARKSAQQQVERVVGRPPVVRAVAVPTVLEGDHPAVGGEGRRHPDPVVRTAREPVAAARAGASARPRRPAHRCRRCSTFARKFVTPGMENVSVCSNTS